jgi:gamma-glutamylputrescine oxidase
MPINCWGLSDPPVFNPLASDERVDVAILGGGFAGLSAARHLKKADPSLDIALLERERIGFGASGRNAGILSPFMPIAWLIDCTSSRQRLQDICFAAEFIREQTEALLDLIHTEGIECDVRPGEIVTAGADRRNEKLLALLGERILLTRIPGRPASLQDLRWVNPDAGHAGYVLYGTSLQPLSLAYGLALHARALGVAIYEKTGIVRILSESGGIRLIEQSGKQIRAKKVILATNAYTAEIEMGRTVSIPGPIHTYLLATAEMDADSLSRLGVESRVRVEIGREYFYARRYGNRLLFGGFDRVSRTSQPSPKADEVFCRRLEIEMRRRFPFLSGTPIAATWSGPYHETRTQVPVIRPLPGMPDVILNIGYGGVGVTLTQFSGKLIASMILGGKQRDERSERMLALYRSTKFPVREGIKLGFRYLGSYLRSEH